MQMNGGLVHMHLCVHGFLRSQWTTQVSRPQVSSTLFFHVCKYVCNKCHGMYVEVRGKLAGIQRIKLRLSGMATSTLIYRAIVPPHLVFRDLVSPQAWYALIQLGWLGRDHQRPTCLCLPRTRITRAPITSQRGRGRGNNKSISRDQLLMVSGQDSQRGRDLFHTGKTNYR